MRPRTLRCWFCGKQLSHKTKTIDHLKPLSKGGSNAKKNVVDACRRCNLEKGCLSLDEFRLVMAYRAGALSLPNWKFPGELPPEETHVIIDIRIK